MFTEANLKINHLQLAASALAFLNHYKYSAQIWVVPAGHGKSVIHSALTFLFLEHTDYDVYVIFQHEGLLNVDKERNKKLQINRDAAGSNYSTRVRY